MIERGKTVGGDRRPPIPQANVVDQLQRLGVARGGVLLVHTSFRSVAPIEGGPRGFIDALTNALGQEGTLVMPSWPDGGSVYDPGSSEVAADLGIVAATFWRLPGVLRSHYPQAFAARGPCAAEILRDPLPLPPHRPESPVGRVHELDGQVLLVGVDHDADTTIHLAELLAGVPYRVRRTCLVAREGEPESIEYAENDHCCARFTLVDGWLEERGLQTKGPLGNGSARLARARDIVGTVVERLRMDPLLFLHAPELGCTECDEARSGLGRPPGNGIG